jgi:C-terminal processing protease CtpA/Prc
LDDDEDEWIEQLEVGDSEKGSKRISSDMSISSLSCFSSFSGNRSFGGDLYEVLVANEKNLGLVVKSDGSGPWVHCVKPSSPLTNLVKKGDYILSIDGTDTRRMTAQQLSRWLHEYSKKETRKKDKTIIFKSPLEIDPSSREMI